MERSHSSAALGSNSGVESRSFLPYALKVASVCFAVFTKVFAPARCQLQDACGQYSRLSLIL